MTELNKNWMPEVGQECEINFHSDDEPMWFAIEWYGTKNGAPIFYDLENSIREIVWSDSIEYSIRPCKAEAEKQQDKQIEAIHQTLAADSDWFSFPNKTVAESLYKAGCRMTHKITDVEIAKLYRKHLVTDVSGTGYDFARAIENIILGKN